MANQEKTIDPRILELLGLQDISDLDYGEYKTLLKEAMVKNHPDRGGNLDDFKLLSIERDKVKNEDDKGKVKGKKEGAKSFVSRLALPGGGVKPVPDIKPSENLLEPPDEEEKEDNVIVKGLKSVLDSLKGIADLLSDQFKFDKDAHAAAVKRQKDQDKKDREAALEAKKKSEDQKKSLNIGFKAPQPLTNIFDAFKKFFGNILAGGVVVGLLDWLSKNEGKIDEFANWFQENINGILIGLAALAVLPIALTLFNLAAALVTGIALLKPALAFFFSPWGLLALAAGVVGYVGWKWMKKQVSGGGEFESFDQKLRQETKESGLDFKNAKTGALVLDDEGKPIRVKTWEGDTGAAGDDKWGSFMGRPINLAAGDKGKNTSAEINLTNPSHREWILNYFGEEKLAQLDAAYERYMTLMGQKDALKKEMGDVIRASNKEVSDTMFGGENVPGISLNYLPGGGAWDRHAFQQKVVDEQKRRENEIRAEYDKFVKEKFPQFFDTSGQVDKDFSLGLKDSDLRDSKSGSNKIDDTDIKKNLSSSSVAPGPSTRKINVSTLPIPVKNSSGSSSSDSVANQTEIAYVRPEDPNNTSRDAIEGIFNLTGVG